MNAFLAEALSSKLARNLSLAGPPPSAIVMPRTSALEVSGPGNLCEIPKTACSGE